MEQSTLLNEEQFLEYLEEIQADEVIFDNFQNYFTVQFCNDYLPLSIWMKISFAIYDMAENG